MSTARTVITVMGGVVASLALAVGTLILVGLVLPDTAPASFRWMTGIVMVLYGIYRGLLLFFERQRNAKAIREPEDGKV